MDATSIFGLVFAMGFVLYGILMGGPLKSFYDLPSILIVFGGSVGAVIICCTVKQVKNIGKVFKVAFSNKKQYDLIKTIKQILELSYIARKEGLLALENKSEELDDQFLKKGVLLAVDGVEGQVIENVLGGEIDAMERRHKENREVMDVSAAVFPALGMIGTLIGLINMLKELSSPEELGPQMSIALVTTFYGAMMSNLFFIPISKKLKLKTDNEIIAKEMIIEGIISIQSGENTRFVEQKLLSYLGPEQKEQYAQKDKKEKQDKKGKGGKESE